MTLFYSFIRFLQKGKVIKYVKHSEKQHRIIVCNKLKLTFLRTKCQEKKKNIEQIFNHYKNNNLDIRLVPKATGQLRDIQLANLAILKELDYVCKQNNLKYWLDGGTQIGAVRHGGYIPWDDDIDCGMLREDYNKIFDAFKKSCRNPDIVPKYFRSPETTGLCIIKITHKDNPNLFVDIFPFELYNRKLSEKEKKEKTQIVFECRNLIDSNVDFSMSNEEFLSYTQELQKTKILENEITNEELKPDIFWGLEFPHRWKNWFHNYDDFFPLKEINFEGFLLPIINNPDGFLSGVYGNYMDYPEKTGNGHNMLRVITKKEKQIIDSLIKELENE